MADETNGVKQPDNPMMIGVNRNNVDIVLKEQRTTRGQNPGKMVFDPQATTDEEKQLFLNHVGLNNVFGIVKAKYRGLTLGWVEESVNKDTGEFNQDTFRVLAQDFDASGETKSDLEGQREDILEQIAALDLSDNSQAVALLELGREAKRLTLAIDKKSRPRNKEAVAA